MGLGCGLGCGSGCGVGFVVGITSGVVPIRLSRRFSSSPRVRTVNSPVGLVAFVSAGRRTIVIRGAVATSPPGVRMWGVNGSLRVVEGTVVRMLERPLRERVGATETGVDGVLVTGVVVRVDPLVRRVPLERVLEERWLDEGVETVVRAAGGVVVFGAALGAAFGAAFGAALGAAFGAALGVEVLFAGGEVVEGLADLVLSAIATPAAHNPKVSASASNALGIRQLSMCIRPASSRNSRMPGAILAAQVRIGRRNGP